MKKKLRETDYYKRQYEPLRKDDERRLRQFTCNEEELEKYFGYLDDQNKIVYNYLLGVFVEINYKEPHIEYYFF